MAAKKGVPAPSEAAQVSSEAGGSGRQPSQLLHRGPLLAWLPGKFRSSCRPVARATPQMDVNSVIAQLFSGDEAKLQDYLKFRDSLTGLKNPTRISDVIASGLDHRDETLS